MKTVLYIMIALFLSANFTACTTDSIAEEELSVADAYATTGEDGHIEPEDEPGPDLPD